MVTALRDLVRKTCADDLPIVSYRIDERSGSVGHVSPWLERVTGHRPEMWVGTQRWSEHIHTEDRDRVSQEHAQAVAAGAEFRGQYRLIAASGATVWVDDTEIVSASGTREGVLVDITAQRSAQLEAERVRRMAADELHDHILQVLTAALVLLDRLELSAARDGREGETASARSALAHVMERVSRLTVELSPQDERRIRLGAPSGRTGVPSTVSFRPCPH